MPETENWKCPNCGSNMRERDKKQKISKFTLYGLPVKNTFLKDIEILKLPIHSVITRDGKPIYVTCTDGYFTQEFKLYQGHYELWKSEFDFSGNDETILTPQDGISF